MPRRTWIDGDLERLAREMTEALKTPWGTMKLRPVQALALYEIAQTGGLFGPIRVGGGKTLIALLAPFVLQARKPLLLMPAALIHDYKLRIRELSRHWKIPLNIRMESYERLSRDYDKFLEEYRPDLIVPDEAHRLKNKRAGVTRKVLRFMREYPETKVVAISGTVLTNSLRDFAHILRWSLKKGAPVPATDGEVEEWADALDEKVQALKRADPGALLTFCAPEDEDAPDVLSAARRGFRRRLTETSGVVTTAGDQVACSLYISPVRYSADPIVDKHLHTLRSKWETPDGWALSEAVAVWRHARELALGLHYVWDPRPPAEWLDARREWAKFVRDMISRSRSLDTELQVARACEAGTLGTAELNAWREIRPSFTPVPRPIWHCSKALELCQEWMKKKTRGIVWVEHTFFAHELERRSGFPYFGAEGKDGRGRPIESATGGPIIASVAANSTGRNLQWWNQNLLTSCPGTATRLEQLIGRTHRDGQTADEVEVEILLGCWEHWSSFEAARASARMAQDMLGQPQKILIADVDWPTEAEILRLPGARWTKTVELEKPSLVSTHTHSNGVVTETYRLP